RATVDPPDCDAGPPARPSSFATPASGPASRASTRRPLQRAAAQHVQVDVVHRLPRVRPRVHDQPVPAVGHALRLRDLLGRQVEPADQLGVRRLERVDRGDVPPRDHQHVYGRLRVDVPERDRLLVLAHDLRRDLAGDDLTEDAVVRHLAPPSLARTSLAAMAAPRRATKASSPKIYKEAPCPTPSSGAPAPAPPRIPSGSRRRRCRGTSTRGPRKRVGRTVRRCAASAWSPSRASPSTTPARRPRPDPAWP